MKRFQDRIVIVTGAASGIGRASALRLAEEGGVLLCADHNRGGAEETAAMIGPTARAFSVDVADAASCNALLSAAIEHVGRIDALCNVAGIGGFGHAAEISDETWGRLIDVNLTGTFYMTRAALPHLTASHGNVVNIASAAGLVGTPYATAYSASKSGVVGFTRSLAIEYAARAVRVNAICPGAVETPLIAGGFDGIEGVDWELVRRMSPKLGPMAQPEDIAAAVAFLASDDARFVTGTILAIDGGQTAG